MSQPERIRDLDCVVLLRDVVGYDAYDFSEKRTFAAGDVGTVVMEFEDGAAFEIEFVSPERTLGFVTAERTDVRLATDADFERREAEATSGQQ